MRLRGPYGPVGRLTEAEISAAEPRSGLCTLQDGGGLCLLVHARGSRRWYWRYNDNGKQCSFSLGSYPAISLADARLARRYAYALVSNGINPTRAPSKKRQERIASADEQRREREKKCTKCHEMRPRSEFYRKASRRDGLHSHCKPCMNFYMAAYQQKHRKRLTEKAREWRSDRGDRARRVWCLTRYGITLERCDEMLLEQGGRCAICRTDKPGGYIKDRFHIDHDHATKKVRGLLCHKCNSGIGMLKDSAVLLRAAARYLESSEGCVPFSTGYIAGVTVEALA